MWLVHDQGDSGIMVEVQNHVDLLKTFHSFLLLNTDRIYTLWQKSMKDINQY